jgi:hypothetical protein
MTLRLKLLTVAAALILASDSSAQNPTLRTAMHDKLANAQELLDALIHVDYAAIGRSADALHRISDTEIASWQVGAQPEYRRQAMSFLLSVQGLREAAAKRDIDAALDEYSALVSSCTGCHVHLKRTRVISFEPPKR